MVFQHRNIAKPQLDDSTIRQGIHEPTIQKQQHPHSKIETTARENKTLALVRFYKQNAATSRTSTRVLIQQ